MTGIIAWMHRMSRIFLMCNPFVFEPGVADVQEQADFDVEPERSNFGS